YTSAGRNEINSAAEFPSAWGGSVTWTVVTANGAFPGSRDGIGGVPGLSAVQVGAEWRIIAAWGVDAVDIGNVQPLAHLEVLTWSIAGAPDALPTVYDVNVGWRSDLAPAIVKVGDDAVVVGQRTNQAIRALRLSDGAATDLALGAGQSLRRLSAMDGAFGTFVVGASGTQSLHLASLSAPGDGLVFSALTSRAAAASDVQGVMSAAGPLALTLGRNASGVAWLIGPRANAAPAIVAGPVAALQQAGSTGQIDAARLADGTVRVVWRDQNGAVRVGVLPCQ
ncbi:MAG: hypothetical protein KC620_20575, partial [Myxococcales bacterium]|nr:hypothetical protein [Myxococcales bacterium]